MSFNSIEWIQYVEFTIPYELNSDLTFNSIEWIQPRAQEQRGLSVDSDLSIPLNGFQH